MSQNDKDLAPLSQNSSMITQAQAFDEGIEADEWDVLNQELMDEMMAESLLSEEDSYENQFDRKLAQYDKLSTFNRTEQIVSRYDDIDHQYGYAMASSYSDSYDDYNDYQQTMNTEVDEPLYVSPAVESTPKEIQFSALKAQEEVAPRVINASNIIDITSDFDFDFEDDAIYADEKGSTAPNRPKRNGANTEEIIQNIVEKLNDEQKSAALATEGPVIVIAGAGAGKTNTLIHRVAILIEKGIEPGNIMIVTFTNKAANEIKERLYHMVGDMAMHINAGTFHSIIFRKILKQFPNSEYLASQNVDVSELAILDDKDATKMFKEAMDGLDNDEKLALEDNEWKAGDFQDEMTIARAVGMDYKAYQRGIQPGSRNEMFEHLLCRIWKKYTEICRFNNGVDFDDILVLANNMLRAEPHIADELGKEFRYLHLDEYQDTNPVQMSIMDRIAQQHRNIFVVGDEKQSIYKFRGADINVILSFEQRYTEATKVTLNKNYRSNPAIIALANVVAGEMPQKLSDGQLNPQSDRLFTKPSIVEFATTEQEAQIVAQAIQRDIRKGTNPEEIAVLYREKSDKTDLERELVRLNIDYTLIGDTSFYKKAEVKDMISALRFIARPWDSRAGLRLLDGSIVGAKMIQEKTGKAVARSAIGFNEAGAVQAMNSEGINVHTFIGNKVEELSEKSETLNTAQEKAKAKRLEKGIVEPTKTELTKERTRFKAEKEYLSARAFLGMIDTINEAIEEKDDPEIIKEQLEHFWSVFMRPKIQNELSGEKVKKQSEINKNNERNKKILDNVHYLTKRFSDALKEGLSVDQIIDDLTLMIEGQDLEETPSVQLMTMHASKGLEFDKCYLIGMEAGDKLDPHENPDDYNEERRIVYVAVTRGKDNVTISFANEKKKFGSYQAAVVSPFVQEIIDKDPDTFKYVNYPKHLKSMERSQSNGYGR